MHRAMHLLCAASVLFLFFAHTTPLLASSQYFRAGKKEDSHPKPTFGIAMMGGGEDLDDAFRFLCQKAHGGDFLILRAHGDDDYNPYIDGLCKLNSVATLIIPDRDSARDPQVAAIIRQAEALFIAGGDQSRYVNFWKGTPVQDAVNSQIARGVPIGGTSAGLAVLGEFGYGALADKPDDNDLASSQVLPNPYFSRVTLVRDFLKISLLRDSITDSHFAKRDRMGRTLGFLARLMEDRWSSHPREIAIDERSAVLVEPDGKSTVVGPGRGAYFLRPTRRPKKCQPDMLLNFGGISAYRAPAGSHFNLRTWKGNGGQSYTLAVDQGKILSTQKGSEVY
ncbi:MAG TPA: cyanophycinase [Terriglobales bacterium]